MPRRSATWFADQADSGSLVEYLKTFDVTTAVMQTARGPRAGRPRVRAGPRRRRRHLRRDPLGARAAPRARASPSTRPSRPCRPASRRASTTCAGAGTSIRVGQLVTAMRHADRGARDRRAGRAPPRPRRRRLRHRRRRAGLPGRATTARAFDYLAQEFFPVTVHAGEADGLDSIRGALFDGRALRLGHGVRLAEDIAHRARGRRQHLRRPSARVAQWVRDREIALELSPSSNLQTGAIAAWGDELVDHPFDLLYQLGFRVTVNTDNRLMSDTTPQPGARAARGGVRLRPRRPRGRSSSTPPRPPSCRSTTATSWPSTISRRLRRGLTAMRVLATTRAAPTAECHRARRRRRATGGRRAPRAGRPSRASGADDGRPTPSA